MATQITLDTNCLYDYFERDPTHIQNLICLQAQGYIEIAITTRVMADTLDKWKGEGSSPIWAKIQSFPIIETIGSAFTLDMLNLDTEDFLISAPDVKILNRLRMIMMNAQTEDIDHLFGHITAKRDIFVTGDPHFLRHRIELKREFGAVIFRPEEAVKEIKSKIC